MALTFRALHAPSAPDLLNEEYLLVENTGSAMLNAKGVTLFVGKPGQHARAIGTLEPGFVLQPGEKALLVTGSPAKKAWGTPPIVEGARIYYLFLREPVLKAGHLVSLSLKQRELASARYAPDGKDGIATA